MNIAVVGGLEYANQKFVNEKLDRLTEKLTKPTLLLLHDRKGVGKFAADWAFGKLGRYVVYWEGFEKMLRDANAVIAFGEDKEVRQILWKATKDGVKIRRYK